MHLQERTKHRNEMVFPTGEVKRYIIQECYYYLYSWL